MPTFFNNNNNNNNNNNTLFVNINIVFMDFRSNNCIERRRLSNYHPVCNNNSYVYHNENRSIGQ